MQTFLLQTWSAAWGRMQTLLSERIQTCMCKQVLLVKWQLLDMPIAVVHLLGFPLKSRQGCKELCLDLVWHRLQRWGKVCSNWLQDSKAQPRVLLLPLSESCPEEEMQNSPAPEEEKMPLSLCLKRPQGLENVSEKLSPCQAPAP